MNITDRNRKILWGRSGNKCAICKHDLVIDATLNNDESIVGEECHIVSGSPNGPRHDPTYPQGQIDSYENLMLLCRIHHKMVDDQSETYTTDILRQMKTNHENWVTEKLNQCNIQEQVKIKRIKSNIPSFLNRLTTGTEILNIVHGCCMSSFTHDELHNQEEVDLVGGFFQVIGDWIDIGSDLGPGDRVSMAFDLSQSIKELEGAGFYVFGAREVQRIEGGVASPSAWPVVILRVIRQSNEEIIYISADDLKQKNVHQQHEDDSE
ncbi:MAG: HNH endonuclease [Deltaproteobacteria bacterium]|nr:HNH endonuclease [Deltaproteobacteria bacterium]